jgi:hypothetical protein
MTLKGLGLDPRISLDKITAKNPRNRVRHKILGSGPLATAKRKMRTKFRHR